MKSRKQERGFTIIEIAIVVLLVGVLVTFAAPRITNAMREYRLNVAMRQMADMIQKVKMQAVSYNRKASLAVDTATRKIGLVTYDASNTVVGTEYINLPQGVTFDIPANNNAPVTGAPTTGNVSFAAQNGSSTIFQQDFNSRGLPVVTAGAVNAVYLTNGNTFRAVTMNSVGGLRTFVWTGSAWKDVRR